MHRHKLGDVLFLLLRQLVGGKDDGALVGVDYTFKHDIRENKELEHQQLFEQ